MKTRTHFTWITVASLLFGAGISPARATVVAPGQALAVAHVFNVGNGTSEIIHSLNLQLGYLSLVDYFTVEHPLFEQYTLTESDVGRVFVATAQNDSDFTAFVQQLTDGRNELLALADSLGGSGGANESIFFNQRPAGSNGIDLRGFAVGSIALRVDSLTIASPGSNPNADGVWTDVFFQGTITVYAVPEPAHLTGFGFILMRALRRCCSQG